MVKGSCCCGAVLFELTAQPSMMGTCHCSRCRKVGASTIAFVKKDTLTWVAGKEHVATYVPAAPYKYARCFCKFCGTSLGEILSDDDSFPIAANTFDSGFTLSNQFHEHEGEKPHWYDLCDATPSVAAQT